MEKNIRKIECVGENLEDFIKYGDQIPAYRFFQGGLDSRFSKKTHNYYNLGKKFSDVFDKGEDFLESLKNHVESCGECSKIMEELKTKYAEMEKEDFKGYSDQTINNLRYFGLL